MATQTQNSTIKTAWLSRLKSTLTVLSFDGIAKSIEEFTAMYSEGVTLADAKAELSVAKTRSEKSYVSNAIALVYGSYVRAQVEGLSMTDAYAYALTLTKVCKQDFALMDIEIDGLTTVDDVINATESLQSRILKPVKPMSTPLSELSASVAKSVATAKSKGIDLDTALAEAVASVRAQYAK